MEDWTAGPAPWLNAIKYGAGVASGVVGAAAPAAGPYGAIVATGVGMIVGTISDGIDAYDTQKVVAALKRLRALMLGNLFRSTGAANDPDYQALLQVLDVALEKKERHRDIAIGQAATLQVGRIGVAAYRAGRAIQKKISGTKGVGREEAAATLMRLRDQNGWAGEVAREIVKVLCKKSFDDLLKSSIKESLRS